MPDHPAPPVELAYSTFNAGTLSWHREGDLLLITVRPPPASPRSAGWWRPVLALWAGLFVAAIVGFSVAYGPGPAATRAAFLLTGVLVAGHVVLILIGRLSNPHRLYIRVNRQKLLIDESGHNMSGGSSVLVSVTGRAWTADEITSVTAVDGSLRVKTRTRRLPPLSITGYDPSDLAFAADAIRKVLADGVDAWVASQAPLPSPPPRESA